MKNIERKLWSVAAVMFLFFTLLWTCRCSTQNELFSHYPLDAQITFSTPEYVWMRVGNDTIKRKNPTGEMYFVNELIPVRNEYRNVHCLD